MTTLKKIFAAATAVASVGVLTMATMAVSAAPAPSEEPPYTVELSISAGTEQAWGVNAVSVPGNGSYTSEYTFTQGSSSIELLLFDSSINLYSFAPEGTTDVAADTSVRMTCDGIKIVRVDGTEEAITYNGPGEDAFMTGDNGSCARLNILNIWGQNTMCTDIDTTLPGEGVAVGDKIVIDWSVSGLAADSEGGDNNDESGDTTTTTTTTTGEGGEGSTTTTTTTKNNSSSGSSSNKNNSSSSSSNKTSNSTTSTVTKTADAGVVAIVVGAAAAASLAVGTMTYKRKRK